MSIMNVGDSLDGTYQMVPSDGRVNPLVAHALRQDGVDVDLPEPDGSLSNVFAARAAGYGGPSVAPKPENSIQPRLDSQRKFAR